MSFFKSNPKPAGTLPPPVATASPAAPTLDQVIRRLGRIERDLIDIKAHLGIARRPPPSGQHDEPAIR